MIRLDRIPEHRGYHAGKRWCVLRFSESGFWILGPHHLRRRTSWDVLDTWPSSAAKSWTWSRPDAASPTPGHQHREDLHLTRPESLGPLPPACATHRHHPSDPRRFQRRVRGAAGARRTYPGPRTTCLALHGGDTDAAGRPHRDHKPPQVAACACESGLDRPGGSAVQPPGLGPVVSYQYHRAPLSGGQGVLRGDAGRVLAACGRVGDRFLVHGSFDHERAGHGHRRPRTKPGDDDPLRAWSAGQMQLVVAAPRSRRCAMGRERKQIPEVPAGGATAVGGGSRRM